MKLKISVFFMFLFSSLGVVSYAQEISRPPMIICDNCGGPNGNWQTPFGNFCDFCFFRTFDRYPPFIYSRW